MIIQSADIYRYRIPLSRPILMPAGAIREREGLLLKISSDTGAVGWGEAAPLEGLHLESVEEALQQLSGAVPALLNRPIPAGLEALKKIKSEGLPLPQYYPSVRWAIETALMTVYANAKHRPLAGLISDRYDHAVPVNALLLDTETDLVRQTEDLLAQGFRTIKLKVGRLSLAEDVERVLSVSRVIEGKALLRLDANKAWTVEQAVEFIAKVGLNTIEYIEEPLQDIKAAEQFYQDTYMPVGIDESLAVQGFDPLSALGGVDVLVLKPSVVGSFVKVLDLAERAHARALRVVFSSAFESGYGLTVIAHLASCLARGVPAGLDTMKYFQSDVLKNPVVFDQGAFSLDRFDLLNVDFNYDVMSKCHAG